ncbi:hypothetical protein [Microbacterium sp. LWH3-1.2]|uniref:hypothetical protein n=1 Tax=Microbacterium sp. LWH3-1.2 TaxID=3135256 RepID=UPI00343E1EE1
MTADPTLAPGEEVLWTGSPDPKRILTGWDGFLIPFSVFWVAVGIDLSLDAQRGPQVVTLVGVTVTGLYLVVGRFLVKTYRKRRTRYVLTDTRAIICGPRRTFSFNLADRNPRVQVIGRRGHRTLKFTSDDPRSYGKFSSELFVNTGLDFLLRPGLDARFSFYDVLRTDALHSAVSDMVTSGKVAEGIA